MQQSNIVPFGILEAVALVSGASRSRGEQDTHRQVTQATSFGRKHAPVDLRIQVNQNVKDGASNTNSLRRKTTRTFYVACLSISTESISSMLMASSGADAPVGFGSWTPGSASNRGVASLLPQVTACL